MSTGQTRQHQQELPGGPKHPQLPLTFMATQYQAPGALTMDHREKGVKNEMGEELSR